MRWFKGPLYVLLSHRMVLWFLVPLDCQAAGVAKPSLMRNLIDEYTHQGTLDAESRDIMSAGAVSYIGV